ncbi:MAG: DUF1549 domain-containing protein, partial [Planctomycetaceae bacterium]|nr:DUF1549 domain-containing protein [Planctomycetaceae bacterium]
MSLALVWSLPGGIAAAADNDGLFEQQVAPIFQRRCLSCHSGESPQGGFSLKTAATALADGQILPGDAAGSPLMELITPAGGMAEMPKKADPLTTKEIATIRQWIDRGAKWPGDLTLTPPRVSDFSWWSYQPLKRPAVPPTEDRWAASPVDAFILRKLKQKGLTPSAPADRRTLIRRVTFDLTGLPPAP